MKELIALLILWCFAILIRHTTLYTEYEIIGVAAGPMMVTLTLLYFLTRRSDN